MTESGISAWALFLPTYGLFYRPWMRRVAAVLWVLLGIFSVACGFLELYRNIPGAKQAISVLYELSGFPDALTWLESHASVRLSILATYLLSKSQLFEWAVLHFSHASRLARSLAAVVLRPFRLLGGSLRPLYDALAVVLAPLASAAAAVAAVVADLLQPVWLVVQALLLAPLRLLGALWAAVGPLIAAAWASCRAAAAACGAFWRSVSGVFNVAIRPLLSAAKATHSAGSAASPARSLLSHGKTLWDEIFSGLWRGTRAILLFSSHIAQSLNRHRLSIGIALRARWNRTVGRWLRWAAASASSVRGAATTASMPPAPDGAGDSPRSIDSPSVSGGSPLSRRRASCGWLVGAAFGSGTSVSQPGVWQDDLGGPALAPPAGGANASPGSSTGASPEGSSSSLSSLPRSRFDRGSAGEHAPAGSGSSGSIASAGAAGPPSPGAPPKSFWAALTAAMGSAAHWAESDEGGGGHWAEPPAEPPRPAAEGAVDGGGPPSPATGASGGNETAAKASWEAAELGGRSDGAGGSSPPSEACCAGGHAAHPPDSGPFCEGSSSGGAQSTESHNSPESTLSGDSLPQSHPQSAHGSAARRSNTHGASSAAAAAGLKQRRLPRGRRGSIEDTVPPPQRGASCRAIPASGGLGSVLAGCGGGGDRLEALSPSPPPNGHLGGGGGATAVVTR